MKDNDDLFLGKGWEFPPVFNAYSKTVGMVANEEDIEQSIRIIIGTIPGERLMFPQFGCGIRKFVFESNDPTQMTILKDTVYQALLYNEPRIKVRDIAVHESVPTGNQKEYGRLNGKIYLHISYTVIITNTRNNMVYPFYLEEGTNL
ncbi:MAG: GPW/gp25 family protein [Dokdonia sp.]|jgi:phage baseplate assembly protein W